MAFKMRKAAIQVFKMKYLNKKEHDFTISHYVHVHVVVRSEWVVYWLGESNSNQDPPTPGHCDQYLHNRNINNTFRRVLPVNRHR